MANQHPDGKHSDRAQRMRQLRIAFEGKDRGSAARFAARMGFSHARWSNFERGYSVNADVAVKLVHALPGLTTDWILMGRREALTLAMADKLDAAAKKMAENSRSRRGRA